MSEAPQDGALAPAPAPQAEGIQTPTSEPEKPQSTGAEESEQDKQPDTRRSYARAILERLSTVGAERAMLEADMSRRKRAERIDAAAAAFILQGVLDRLARLRAAGANPPRA